MIVMFSLDLLEVGSKPGGLVPLRLSRHLLSYYCLPAVSLSNLLPKSSSVFIFRQSATLELYSSSFCFSFKFFFLLRLLVPKAT